MEASPGGCGPAWRTWPLSAKSAAEQGAERCRSGSCTLTDHWVPSTWHFLWYTVGV